MKYINALILSNVFTVSAVITVTQTVTQDCAATPLANNNQGNQNQGNQAQAGNAPAGNGATGNANAAQGAKVDLGLCAKPPTMAFGTGFQGSANAQEFRFKPENEDVFIGQQTALNGNIIANFLCDRVRDTCKAPTATQDLCTKAKEDFTKNFDLNTTGTAAGKSAADKWNAVFTGAVVAANAGNAGANAGNAGSNAGNGAAANTGNGANAGNAATGGANNCNADKLEVIVQGQENRFGFQGRQVALNPAIPIQNICQKVSANCAAACKQAGDAAIATGVKGFSGAPNPAVLQQMGELADKFNAALGNKSEFGKQFNAGAAAGGAAGGATGGAGGANVQCNAKKMEVITQGRENRFGLDGQQVALNPAIVTQRICQAVNQACAAKCTAAAQAVDASGVKGFQDVDAAKLKAMNDVAAQFNAALA